MVKLSSRDPLDLLFPPGSDEMVANRSRVKPGRVAKDMSESERTEGRRDGGLGEGENTPPGMAFEMNR